MQFAFDPVSTGSSSQRPVSLDTRRSDPLGELFNGQFVKSLGMSRRPNAIFQASDTKLSGTCRISFEPNMVVHHVPFIVLPARGERRFGLAVKAATFYSCASDGLAVFDGSRRH